MCDILQIIGVKQEGNVPRQASAPQGTNEPANSQPSPIQSSTRQKLIEVLSHQMAQSTYTSTHIGIYIKIFTVSEAII